MFWKRLEQQEKTLAAERGRSPSDAASVFGGAAGASPAAANEEHGLIASPGAQGAPNPAAPPLVVPPVSLPSSADPSAGSQTEDALGDQEPFPEEPFEETRRPRLTGTGKANGRRLVKPEESPQPAMTAEQRLLVLDTWLRSGLPAGDFAPLVGVSKHTLYAWKKRFDQQGPGGLMDQSRGLPQGSRMPDLTKRTILMLKQANPEWGCQRISDMLLRGPALPASPNAVAKVLHEAG